MIRVPRSLVVVRPRRRDEHLCGRVLSLLMSLFVTFSKLNVMKKDILPQQVRAARALIDWTRDDLANASGLTVRTLARIESSQTIPRQTTLEALAKALEAAGIEFISQNGGGPGVRLARRLDGK
ncbi:helix-turn-helix transcriptional regulator [Mesorhizobium sp. M0510]|uniref:helix-turn-helix domain-containing protein n=1 Tax=Mesorhizobium sp. M0510 TaxID=2956954 RepID=UPI00333D3A6F